MEGNQNDPLYTNFSCEVLHPDQMVITPGPRSSLKNFQLYICLKRGGGVGVVKGMHISTKLLGIMNRIKCKPLGIDRAWGESCKNRLYI